MDAEKKFDAALAVIKSLPEKGPYRPSNETLLVFYGYYKQATHGNNTQSQPWSFDIVAKAKWDAWKKFENLSKANAMQGYVDTLLKVIEDIPESEKQSLVGLDNKNVLQEFLSLANGYSAAVEPEIVAEVNDTDVQIDECTSIKSDDEYWDADRVDSDCIESIVKNVKTDDNEHKTSSYVPDSADKILDTSTENDVDRGDGKTQDDVSLSEFQTMFNASLGELQKDISNVIVAVSRLEEALKVPADRADKPSQDIRPAQRAVEASTNFKSFLRWNWKWALFLVIWPFITQMVVKMLKAKRKS